MSETRQPIKLLLDRTASTLAEWLQKHPGVEIISRDRAKAYKEGASKGCPEAIQVADRFHLLQNLVNAGSNVRSSVQPTSNALEKC